MRTADAFPVVASQMRLLFAGYNQGSDCEIGRAGKLHEGKEIMQLNPSMVTFEAVRPVILTKVQF